MRPIVPSLLAALICVAFAPMSYASGIAKSTELSKLISQSGDTNMATNDLAFFLATHNYDATPKTAMSKLRSTVQSTRSCPTVHNPDWRTCQLSISIEKPPAWAVSLIVDPSIFSMVQATLLLFIDTDRAELRFIRALDTHQ